MFEGGSSVLALGAALVLFGGLFVETRLLLRWRVDGYFLPGLPLGQRLVPVVRAPGRSGRTASVRWERSAPNLVRFWADPSERAAPVGLHGVVILAQGRSGVELDVRWAPPWSLLLAALWLGLLGLARGDGVIVPIAAALALGVLAFYGERARQAAAELRWAFVTQEDGGGPEPEDAV